MLASPIPEALTVEMFAQKAHICRASVYNMIRRSEIRAVKFGRSTRIPLSELERLLATDARAVA